MASLPSPHRFAALSCSAHGPADTSCVGVEELLRAGDCAAFQRGVEDGHRPINKSARPARVLEIGNSDAHDRCHYSEIDMVAGPGNERYRHRDESWELHIDPFATVAIGRFRETKLC